MWMLAIQVPTLIWRVALAISCVLARASLLISAVKMASIGSGMPAMRSAAGRRTSGNLLGLGIEATRARASAICGPGTNIPKAAAEILSLIQKRRLAA